MHMLTAQETLALKIDVELTDPLSSLGGSARL